MADRMCRCHHSYRVHVDLGRGRCLSGLCRCVEFKDAAPDEVAVAAGGESGGADTPPRHDPGSPPSPATTTALLCNCDADLVPPHPRGRGCGVPLTAEPSDELAEVGGIMRAILNDPDSAHRSQAMQTAVLAAAFVLAFPGPMSRRLLVDTLRELRDDMPHGDSEDHR